MCKIKSILLFMLIAPTLAHAATVEELVSAQRAAMANEAQRKANEHAPAVQQPAFIAAPKPTNEDKSERVLDDLRLIAVYGEVGSLTADVQQNGAIFSIKQGGEAIAGWRASEITTSRVTLRRFSAKTKKYGAAHTMYLSAPATNATSAGPSMNPSMQVMPPIPMGGGMPSVVQP